MAVILQKRVRKPTVPTELQSTERAAESRELDYIGYVTQHPDYARIVNSLKNGMSVKSIVRWLERNQRLNGISVSIMTSAIHEYRTRYSDAFNGTDHAGDTLEKLLSYNDKPPHELELELTKLYDLQKKRLAIEVATEVQLGKLFENTHKELRVAVDILQKLHEVQSGNSDSGAEEVALSKRSTEFSPEIRAELSRLKIEEQSKTRLTSVLAQFAKHIHENKKTS